MDRSLNALEMAGELKTARGYHDSRKDANEFISVKLSSFFVIESCLGETET